MSILVPRTVWGSTFDYSRRHKDKPADPNKIETCLHTSVTIAPDLVEPFDDEFRAMRTLERIGVERFKSGISYNAAVMPSGRAYRGQPLGNKSTHSEFGDWNFTRASIVLVGDYSKTKPTTAMLRTVAQIQAEWSEDERIKKTDLRWHAQVAPKACPGKYAINRIPEIDQWTKDLLRPSTYKVQLGDTWPSVAAKTNVKLLTLVRLNRPKLQAGETLRLRHDI